MANQRCAVIISVLSLLFLFATPFKPAGAETLVGSNVDSRIVIGLRANEAGIQSMLPEGWTLTSFPGGPLKGANTLVVLIDRHLSKDAQGAPTEPPNQRGAALASLAQQNGGDAVRLFVTRIFGTSEGDGPYGNSARAEIMRKAGIESSGNYAPALRENWTIIRNGGEMKFSLTYASGTPAWSSGEALPYSAVDPEFHRIYRYEQLADVAMSEALDKPLSGKLAFSSTLPDAKAIFDGREKVVAVITVPMYVREVFLP